MKNSRALITGITGMVGSHLADYLLENTEWDIYGMCRWRSPLDNVEHLLDRVNKKDRVYFKYGDLNDPHSLIKVLSTIKPKYVFHLAAQSYPQFSFKAKNETLRTNIIGTNNLLDAMHDLELDPLIHVCSSSEVYGRVTKEELPIREETKFHPASPYAISKIGTDLIGKFYASAYNLKIMITRMFTHTGPRRGDVFAESTFAKQIALIEEGLIPPVVKTGNLNSLRTWSDVRDAVRAYYLLLTKNPKPGEIYNIGGTYHCTIGEMLEHLISMSSVDDISIETESKRLRPIDADLQVPDTTKFTEHTGWKPKYSFEETMKDLLNYWRDRVKSGRRYLDR